MSASTEQLREQLRSIASSLAQGSRNDEAVAILSETADHEALAPSVVNAADSLHDAIAQAAAEWLDAVADDEWIPFETGYKPLDTQVLRLTVAEVPVLASTRPALEPPDRGVQFDINQATLSRLRGYSYSAEVHPSDWIHFFRRLTRSNFQLQRGRELAARLVNNRYELVPERGLRLDTDFDAVAIGADLLVRHRRNFERLLDFAQMTVAHAQESAAAVVEHLSVKGAEEFVRVVSTDGRMYSKLQSAYEKMADPAYKAKITDETIAALIHKRTDVDLEVIVTDGSIELVFDPSAQRRWTLLKILDDDYLISELTDSRYQAPSKHSGTA